MSAYTKAAPGSFNLRREKTKLLLASSLFVMILLTSLIIVSVSIYRLRGEELKDGTANLLSQIVEQQSDNLALELFLSRTGAYRLRHEDIEKRLRNVVDSARLCIVDLHRRVLASSIDNCAEVVKNSAARSPIVSGNAITLVNAVGERSKPLGYAVIRFDDPTAFGSVMAKYKFYLLLLIGGFSLTMSIAGFLFRRWLRQIFYRIINTERQAAVGEVAQMMAHDVRKPINAGILAVTALRPQDSEEARFFESAKAKIIAARLQVERMLADVISFGDITSKQTELVSPRVLVSEGIADVMRSFGERRVSFRYEFSHSFQIEVEVAKVRRILCNILFNAYEATPDGGEIWVTTRNFQRKHAPGRLWVEFCVGNSGSYVKGDDVRHIFEPYFTKGKSGGSGLGLAVAAKFAEHHGGSISCRSDKETGTEFIFTLPCGAARQLDESDNIPLPLQGNKSTGQQSAHQGVSVAANHRQTEPISLRGLLVDDEEVYREGLAKLVANVKNYQIVLEHAGSADEALEKATSPSIDFVILDNHLGDGSQTGVALIPELKARRPNLFICLHSGMLCDVTTRAAKETGADAVISKPMDFSSLEAVLKAVCRLEGASRLVGGSGHGP